MESVHKPIPLAFNSMGLTHIHMITVAATNISVNAQAYLLYETPTTLLARHFNQSDNDHKEKFRLLVHELNGCIVGPGLYQEWTNYIYAARDHKEQNLELCRSEANNMLFYRAIKPIRKDDQLLAWYSPSVESELIRRDPNELHSSSAAGLSSISNQSQCRRCLVDFEHPNILKSHLIFNLCAHNSLPTLDTFQNLKQVELFKFHGNNKSSPAQLSSFTLIKNSSDAYTEKSSAQSAFSPIAAKKIGKKAEQMKAESSLSSSSFSSGSSSSPCSPFDESQRDTENYSKNSCQKTTIKRKELNNRDCETQPKKVKLEKSKCEGKNDLFDFRSIESIQRKDAALNKFGESCEAAEESAKFMSKNNANGVDWKITMLDGTQTVELNVSDEMGKHKKTHVCLFCGKIYNRKYGLKIHLRTHTGYKPLKCKVCSRPFSDPSNLNKHVRLHSQGDTPYRCPYCGKILVRKRDLDRHIISRHSGKDSAESPNQLSASETCKTNADEETDSENSVSNDNMDKMSFDESTDYQNMVNYLEQTKKNLIQTFLE